jgi:hypothetical protein
MNYDSAKATGLDVEGSGIDSVFLVIHTISWFRCKDDASARRDGADYPPSSITSEYIEDEGREFRSWISSSAIGALGEPCRARTLVDWRGGLIAHLSSWEAAHGIRADWPTMIDAWRMDREPPQKTGQKHVVAAAAVKRRRSNLGQGE